MRWHSLQNAGHAYSYELSPGGLLQPHECEHLVGQPCALYLTIRRHNELQLTDLADLSISGERGRSRYTIGPQRAVNHV
jgi:hypothetical protein